MIRYIAKRVLMMIPVLLAVSFVVYFLMDLAPGDLVDSMNTMDMTTEQIEELRKQYGLDGNVFERYIRYIGNLLKVTWAIPTPCRCPCLTPSCSASPQP